MLPEKPDVNLLCRIWVLDIGILCRDGENYSALIFYVEDLEEFQ